MYTGRWVWAGGMDIFCGCGSVCECVSIAVRIELLKWEENVITKFAFEGCM